MIALDETTAANGSLEMLPGWHKKGLLGEMWEPLTDDDTCGEPYTALHCAAGDAVFFDSYIPHKSSPNRSSQARRVLYVTYNAASAGDRREQYYEDKRKAHPPDIERDPARDYAFKV